MHCIELLNNGRFICLFISLAPCCLIHNIMGGFCQISCFHLCQFFGDTSCLSTYQVAARKQQNLTAQGISASHWTADSQLHDLLMWLLMSWLTSNMDNGQQLEQQSQKYVWIKSKLLRSLIVSFNFEDGWWFFLQIGQEANGHGNHCQ